MYELLRSENLDFSNLFNLNHLSNDTAKSCWAEISFNNVIFNQYFQANNIIVAPSTIRKNMFCSYKKWFTKFKKQ